MFNPLVGTAGEVDGRSVIHTAPGAKGHAIYGPYRWLEAGNYAVEFQLERNGDVLSGGDPICAILDVTRDAGTVTLAAVDVSASTLAGGMIPVPLQFTLDRGAAVEFRAFTTGAAGLTIDGNRRLVRLNSLFETKEMLAEGRFPERNDIPFLRDNRAYLRQLHANGARVSIHNDAVVLTIDGISFFARTADDTNFVGELFIEKAYNFSLGSPACVVDIGMNLGLAAMQFVAKPEVKRVIAFEPFGETYQRALANLALNPPLSSKITARNMGLGDRSEDRVITVSQTSDSGAMSTVGSAGDIGVSVRIQDAAEALEPIIADAQRDKLRIIVKVDCEGSEFAIFESLERAGLLDKIDAFLVEWHAMFPDKNQETLIAPLRRLGFMIFDRSPPAGNGFFYAARIGATAC